MHHSTRHAGVDNITIDRPPNCQVMYVPSSVFYFNLFYFWRKIGFYYFTIISNCRYTCGYPQSERWQADNEWWGFSHPYNSELQEFEKMSRFVTFFPNWFLLNQVCYFLLWVIENKWSKWNSQLFNTLGFFSIKKKKKIWIFILYKHQLNYKTINFNTTFKLKGKRIKVKIIILNIASI